MYYQAPCAEPLTLHQGAPFIHKILLAIPVSQLFNHHKQKLEQWPKQHHLAERQQAGSRLIRFLKVPDRTWRS
jgi:hypothetical protein